METKLILFTSAIILGIILFVILRNKKIDKKKLQLILTTWIFSSFYFLICFSFIDSYSLKIGNLNLSTYILYIFCTPSIILLVFFSLYWLKYFRHSAENQSRKQSIGLSRIILFTFVLSSAIVKLLLPTFNELWIQLLIILGSGSFVSLVVGIFLWRQRNKK